MSNLLREWTDIKYSKGKSMKLCAHSSQTTIIQVIHEILKSIFCDLITLHYINHIVVLETLNTGNGRLPVRVNSVHACVMNRDRTCP